MSLYLLARDVGAVLKTKGYPLAFSYGPEILVASQAGSCRVVFERDNSGGDQFVPPRGAHRSQVKANKYVGARAVVWARFGGDGARQNEHELLCDAFVNGLYCAMSEWMHAHAGVPDFQLVEARYLRPDEISQASAANTPAGVAYLMRWRIPEAVRYVDWQGAGLPSEELGATNTGVNVRRNASEDPPETVKT